MQLDHPNVLKIFNYESRDYEIVIQEEFCEAGDLLSFLKNYIEENPGKLLPEKTIKYIMY